MSRKRRHKSYESLGYLDCQTAAEKAQVSRRTIARWVEEGVLDHTYFGRTMYVTRNSLKKAIGPLYDAPKKTVARASHVPESKADQQRQPVDPRHAEPSQGDPTHGEPSDPREPEGAQGIVVVPAPQDKKH